MSERGGRVFLATTPLEPADERSPMPLTGAGSGAASIGAATWGQDLRRQAAQLRYDAVARNVPWRGERRTVFNLTARLRSGRTGVARLRQTNSSKPRPFRIGRLVRCYTSCINSVVGLCSMSMSMSTSRGSFSWAMCERKSIPRSRCLNFGVRSGKRWRLRGRRVELPADLRGTFSWNTDKH